MAVATGGNGLKIRFATGFVAALTFQSPCRYTGVEKREEHAGRHVIWQIASLRSTYKVEHPFRVIKREFGYTKVRFRGLVKNTAQRMTLFVL